MFYIVGTPIGNLKEFTFYAIEILNKCEYILCEDTRTSLVLLKHYDIKKPLKSYHKFNERKMVESIITDLENGKDIALISDAGMPCISDPGNILVNEIKTKQIKYSVISGPCALVNAFILSGFSTPFTFVGFLPDKEIERNKLLNEVKDYKTTLIFYMSNHDIDNVFNSLLKCFGNRKVCVVNEISKFYESVNFTTLVDGYLGDRRGEFVLVCEMAGENNELNDLSIADHVTHYLQLGFNKNEASKLVSKDRKIKKDEVYKIAIELR